METHPQAARVAALADAYLRCRTPAEGRNAMSLGSGARVRFAQRFNSSVDGCTDNNQSKAKNTKTNFKWTVVVANRGWPFLPTQWTPSKWGCSRSQCRGREGFLSQLRRTPPSTTCMPPNAATLFRHVNMRTSCVQMMSPDDGCVRFLFAKANQPPNPTASMLAQHEPIFATQH